MFGTYQQEVLKTVQDEHFGEKYSPPHVTPNYLEGYPWPNKKAEQCCKVHGNRLMGLRHAEQITRKILKEASCAK